MKKIHNLPLHNDGEPEIVQPPIQLEINSAEGKENPIIVPDPPTRVAIYTLNEDDE